VVAKSEPKAEKAPGGGKLMRSETVTVRLDPKLRYLAELAALKHRRTLSSFIEWAIEHTLRDVRLRENSHDNATTVADDAEWLWDVDEQDRFAKLALRYPELLTHEEQKRWKVIRECSYLWRGHYGPNGRWRWSIEEEKLNFGRLRENWQQICAVARGELPASELPYVAEKSSNESSEHTFDDDIPF